MNASVTCAFSQSNREDPRPGSFNHQTFTRDGNMQTPELRFSPCAPPRVPMSNQAALILCIPVLPPTPPLSLPSRPADPLARVRSSLHLLSSTSKRERSRSHTETEQTCSRRTSDLIIVGGNLSISRICQAMFGFRSTQPVACDLFMSFCGTLLSASPSLVRQTKTSLDAIPIFFTMRFVRMVFRGQMNHSIPCCVRELTCALAPWSRSVADPRTMRCLSTTKTLQKYTPKIPGGHGTERPPHRSHSAPQWTPPYHPDPSLKGQEVGAAPVPV